MFKKLNQKIALITGCITVLLVLGAVLFFKLEKYTAQPETSEIPTSAVIESAQAPTPVPTKLNARFEIYTNGTKRIFTDPKYHHQSEDVYLNSEDPSIIQIMKKDITWDEFFKTLPFSLTKDCLVTGTKQTFCTTPTYTLRFFINGIEVPDALDKKINAGDVLRVVYGK